MRTVPSPFRADPAGCPMCKVELVPHPDGHFVCPICRATRARFHDHATVVSPTIASVLALVTAPSNDDSEEEGVTVENHTTVLEDTRPAEVPARPVSVIELAARWGVSTYVATQRLRESLIPIRHENGKLVVDAQDVPDQMPGRAAPVHAASRPVAPPDESREPTHVEPARPAEPAPRVTADVKVFVGDESGRVRRLLLVLERIRDLATTDDLLLLAIHALADYALAAES